MPSFDHINHADAYRYVIHDLQRRLKDETSTEATTDHSVINRIYPITDGRKVGRITESEAMEKCLVYKDQLSNILNTEIVFKLPPENLSEDRPYSVVFMPKLYQSAILCFTTIYDMCDALWLLSVALQTPWSSQLEDDPHLRKAPADLIDNAINWERGFIARQKDE